MMALVFFNEIFLFSLVGVKNDATTIMGGLLRGQIRTCPLFVCGYWVLMRSRIFSTMLLPIPGTLVRSSTVAKGPCSDL